VGEVNSEGRVGECNYYLKARFATDAAARAARPRLVALLAEGEAAYHFWQGTRMQRGQERRLGQPEAAQESQQIAEQFWTAFRARFPLVCGYLGELVGAEDWDNGLAGQMGMLVDPTRECTFRPSSSLVCRGPWLFLQLNGIWPFSEMRLLELYCEDELGAVAVGSVSEDNFEIGACDDPNFDPFAFIDV
jgi:hypothetical protein